MPDDVEHEREGLTRLFQAMLAQAAQHALGRPYGGEWPSAAERRSARAWFLEPDKSFELCCRWAGVPAAMARREIMSRLEVHRG